MTQKADDAAYHPFSRQISTYCDGGFLLFYNFDVNSKGINHPEVDAVIFDCEISAGFQSPPPLQPMKTIPGSRVDPAVCY